MTETRIPTTVLRTCVGGILLVCLGLGLPKVHTPGECALLLLAVLALFATSAPIWVRRDYSLIEPITPLALMVFMGVTLKILCVLWFHNKSAYLADRLLLGQSPEVLLYGTLVIAVSLALVMVGYLVPIRFKADQLFLGSMTHWTRNRVLLVTSGLLIVSALFFVLFARSAGIGFGSLEQFSAKRFTGERGAKLQNSAYYFYRLAAFSKFAYILMVAWVIRERRKLLSLEGFILVVSGALTILLAMAMQSRASLMIVCLDTLIISYYLSKKVHYVRLGIGLGLGAILVVGLLSLRSHQKQDLWEVAERSVAGRDLMDATKTAHIINAVPSAMPYRYGETLVGWLAAPIPESIWRNKPMWSERGLYISRHVYGDRLGLTGVPPGLIAEVYWNLGWVGQIPIMLVMGMALRAFYEGFARNRHVNAVIIYAIVVNRFVVFSFGSDIGTGVLKTGLDLLPLCALMFLVGSRAPAVSPVASRRSALN